MEENNEILILQVRAWLEEKMLVDPDKHAVYQQFIGQCNQFGISEEVFYIDVLRTAYKGANFDEYDDPDPKNDKHTHVIIFGEKLHSLKKLGKVLFDNYHRREEYFEDMSLIKSHVDTLASGDEALEYAKIYKTESNSEKRYLKIVYHLNPKLPYRMGESEFGSLDDILQLAFKDKSVFTQLYNEYLQGKLFIWLEELNKDQALKIQAGKSYNSFLRFVYKVNACYPFYVGDNLYQSPNLLVAELKKNLAFRREVYGHLVNEQLFIWFECMGHAEWQTQYLSATDQILKKGYRGDDLVHASVQKLISIIDPDIPLPSIKANRKEITLLNLEASKPVVVPLKLSLINTGYVNIIMKLDQEIDGVGLDRSLATLFELADKKECDFNLKVDPLLLTKGTLYGLNINVSTEYENLTIPVQLKTVFPLKAFLLYLGKYAVFGFAVFGIVRLLLQILTKNDSWLNPELIVTDFANSLPSDYLSYLFLFLVLTTLITYTYTLIRKVEKI